MWAIVGSSGFEQFDELDIIETLSRETPFGLCANGLYRIKIDDQDALFLCRTGQNEHILPNHVNYRANIYALKKYGATALLALSSVRSSREELKPGDMVVPYQYIDRTKGGSISTFCEDGLLAYISLTHPICEQAAAKLKSHQETFGFPLHFGQAYVCIEGPQFPTMIDARCYQSMGGGIIGMSAFPEFALAREAGLHYLPAHFVVDYVPWGHDIENIESIFEIRQENYHKALMLANWVVKKLHKFADSHCDELGIASSINATNITLSKAQKAWLNVLGNGLSLDSAKNTETFGKMNLASGNKPIPNKLQELLNFVNQYRKDDVHTIKAARKEAKSLNLYAAAKIEIASVKDFAVKVSEREINVRLYHPNPDKDLPIIVYAHGGGFISGTLDSFDNFCRGLAHATQQAVISIDYALAPEHPFPAGLNDVYDVARWVSQHASDIKVSSSHLTLAGDSAGANLVALATDRIVKLADFALDNLILIYPTTDLSHQSASMRTFAQGYLTDASKVRFNCDQYVPKDVTLNDPALSPYYIDKIDDFPRTLVVTAGYDPLRDEGLLFAEKLQKEGVEMEHVHFANMIHGFISFAKLVPDEMHKLYQDIKIFLSE